MRFKSKKTEDLKPNLTPMIDIIFQLLIFFVLTAKFIAFEGQLQAYLPKDRGLQPTSPVLSQNVTLFLAWDDTGKVICQTTQYTMGNVTRQTHEFRSDPNARPVAGGWRTETTIGTPGSSKTGDIIYEYAVPDFVEIEAYLKHRRATYQDSGTSSKGLPVEVNFTGAVPWQMVVSILDICKRLGISDISLSAPEKPYE